MTVSTNADTASVGTKERSVAVFGGKINLTSKQLGIVKIVIPLAVIALCAVIVAVMIYVSLANTYNIAGKFILPGSSGSSFIDLGSGGSYTMRSGSEKQSGEWYYEDGKITFLPSAGESFKAGFIDGKYIAVEDDSFLAGQIPDAALFDAEVTSATGESFAFTSGGKFYAADDSRNTELGSYITDGYFIIVTTKEGSTTYLNCGDGITSSFYQAS